MAGSNERVYGSWTSPISSKKATEGSVQFPEIHVDKASKSDCVYWTEMRFAEQGRYVVCSSNSGKDITEWTPHDFNARTTVHEYGGGACMVHDDKVYFSNFTDQRLYVQTSASSKPEAITDENTQVRQADMVYSEKWRCIYAVGEDHSLVKSGERKEAENVILVINPSEKTHSVLIRGSDFYSSPKISQDGSRIAWIQWNHPNMPWDDTELWIAELGDNGRTIIADSAKKVAGGVDESVMQPVWTADDQLLYISDRTEWWNLYVMTADGKHENLCERSQEIGGPHWQFSTYAYDLDPNNSDRVVTTYNSKLGILDIHSKKYQEINTGYSSHSFVQFGSNGYIYCVAGSPTTFQAVIRVNSATMEVTVIKEAQTLSIDPGYISVAESVTWPSADGAVSHGYYYPPQNKDFTAPAGTFPPLLVKAHGGPTSSCTNILMLKIQYFTSRGMGVLDVNYRGSTGYGRGYRNQLRGEWGIRDVEDCCSGAQCLVRQGKADGEKLCIDGGSAGGFTTLACLTFTDVFKAGACHYGIGDIKLLAADTHKFESQYVKQLIHPFTDEIMAKRSPLLHVDQLNCPVAFFHGDEDKVVPPSQAELMYESVKKKGLPCAFILFQGEQHGFRKDVNIQKALDGEFYFFSKVFGYNPADKHCKIDIENLQS